MGIITYSRDKVKPLPGSVIDRSRPLGFGIHAAWLLSEGAGVRVNDPAGGYLGTVDATTSGVWTKGPRGRALSMTGGVGAVAIDGRFRLDTSRPWTVAAHVRWSANTKWRTVWNLQTDQATAFVLYLSTTAGQEGVNWGSTANFVQRKTPGDITASLNGQWRQIVLTYDGRGRTSAAAYALYVDGIYEGDQNTSNFVSPVAAANYLGRSSDASDTGFDGAISNVLVWRRALTVQDVRRLISDPGSLFPRRPTLGVELPAQDRVDLFNVLDFGATGGGVTDDTIAIQRAINAAVYNAPATVVFPKGTYLVQDPTPADTLSGEAFGPIVIPSSARDVTLRGEGATLKIGPNGVTTSAVRLFGSRCRVVGLIADSNGDVPVNTKGNSGFEINGGADCEIVLCKGINGIKTVVQNVTISGGPSNGHYNLIYNGNATVDILLTDGQSQVQSKLRAVPGLASVVVNTTGSGPDFTHSVTFVGIPGAYALTATNTFTGDTNPKVTITRVVPTQSEEHFLMTNAVRCRYVLCESHDSAWQGFRISGDDNGSLDCSAMGHQGNGLRVNQGTSVEIRGFRSYSTRCDGRSAILIDPGSSPGTPPDRIDFVTISGCHCYCNPNGLADGPASTLKLASARDVIVRDSYFGAGAATNNYAVRLEDCLRSVRFENVRIDPRMIFTPANDDGLSVYQGILSASVSSDGGNAQFTLGGSSSGLVPGKSLFLLGSTEPAYNREHEIDSIVDYPDPPRLVMTTDIAYVSPSVGSNCFARSGVDRVTLRSCHFGNDSIESGGPLDGPMIATANARILDIESCMFDQRWETHTNYNAIEWGVSDDRGFDLLRIVNSEFNFNTLPTIPVPPDPPEATAGRMINTDGNVLTTLITSGKMISYGNKLTNLGTGEALLCTAATSNYNRQLLFSTDGESRSRYVWSTPPNSGDTRTVFAPGDVVQQVVATQPGRLEWLCTASGVSGTSTSLFVLRDAPYKFMATAAGAAVASFDANEEISATPATGIGSLQFGGLRALTVGEAFRVSASGVFSTSGSPYLNFGLSLGKSQVGNGVGGTPPGLDPEPGRKKLMETGAFATTSGASNRRWRLSAIATVKSIGATATVQVMGTIGYETATNTWVEKNIGATDVTSVNTSNTSHNRKVDVWASWDTKSASNTFTCEQFEVTPW